MKSSFTALLYLLAVGALALTACSSGEKKTETAAAITPTPRKPASHANHSYTCKTSDKRMQLDETGEPIGASAVVTFKGNDFAASQNWDKDSGGPMALGQDTMYGKLQLIYSNSKQENQKLKRLYNKCGDEVRDLTDSVDHLRVESITSEMSQKTGLKQGQEIIAKCRYELELPDNCDK